MYITLQKVQSNLMINPKTLAPGWSQMYQHNEDQLEFEDFYLPFGGKLRSDNRWVRLAKLIPWRKVEKVYASSLAGTGGNGNRKLTHCDNRKLTHLLFEQKYP